MNSRIKVLDEKTVSLIAAGEVVERPASVVKELVENSIDAGATSITVEIENAGLKKISVADNGIGMTREEVLLAFQRYATSKIEKIDDLQFLKTMGFRGEALPSIAAVSRIEIISKVSDSNTGTYAKFENGVAKEIKEVGAPAGTSIIVRDLFYNVPVRKKFLKSHRVEEAHIIDVVARYALIHGNKNFRLINDKKEIFFSPQTGNMLENIVSIYGKEYAKYLLPVNYSNEYVHVTGFVSKPEFTKATSAYQLVFVNTRPVASRILNDAIKDAYYRLIPKDRYPFAVISVQIDPKLIDVNVHPTKSQIKFSDELKAYDSVLEAVKQALRTQELIPEVSRQKLIPVYPVTEKVSVKIPHPAPMLPSTERIERPAVQEILPAPEKKIQAELELKELKEPPVMKKISGLRILGQALDTYIIVEAAESILLIDQHAAHERIMLEKLIRQVREIQVQELLEPVTIELQAKEAQAIAENSKMLQELGFVIEQFGRNLYRLRAAPVILGEIKGKEIITDIADELANIGRAKSASASKQKILELVACHSAIKANQKLSFNEMERLIAELYSLEEPYTCAHGRPTIVSLSKKEIEKLFKRT